MPKMLYDHCGDSESGNTVHSFLLACLQKRLLPHFEFVTYWSSKEQLTVVTKLTFYPFQ